MSTYNEMLTAGFSQQHYEFDKLQRFIQEEIYQAHYPINDKLLFDLKAIVIDEVEVIKQKLIEARVNFQSEFFLEMYVQSRQRSLIQMTGALLQHTQAEHIIKITQTRGAEVFCQYIYRVLQDLLGFLEAQYPRYFDQNAWIPTRYRQILIQGFRIKLPQVETNLQRHNIDPELINIIQQPVAEFIITGDNNKTTYQKIIYLNELLDLLEAFTPTYPTTDAQQTLHDLLLAISFNTREYFTYRIRDIQTNLTPATPLTEQIETLYDEGKKIRQYVFTTKLKLNESYPTLQDQLLEWIDTTAEALVKIHNLYTTAEPRLNTTADNEKFPLQTSMEKLAVWARILHDLAETKNPKSIKSAKLFRFIAGRFQTQQTTKMSEKNLSNLFYTPEPSAIASVVEDLAQLKKIGEGLKGKK